MAVQHQPHSNNSAWCVFSFGTFFPTQTHTQEREAHPIMMNVNEASQAFYHEFEAEKKGKHLIWIRLPKQLSCFFAPCGWMTPRLPCSGPGTQSAMAVC
jgi:hypothetical protein